MNTTNNAIRFSSLLFAAAFYVVSASGGEPRVWTGGGSGWSDGANWGGTAPGSGDTAVIPSGATAVAVASDLSLINTLAEIELEAADSTVRFKPDTAAMEIKCPVSGPGRYEVLDSGNSSSYRFKINVSNADFTGPFVFSNTLVTVMHNKGLAAGATPSRSTTRMRLSPRRSTPSSTTRWGAIPTKSCSPARRCCTTCGRTTPSRTSAISR